MIFRNEIFCSIFQSCIIKQAGGSVSLDQVMKMFPTVPQKDIDASFWIDNGVVTLREGTKAVGQGQGQPEASRDPAPYSSHVDDHVRQYWNDDFQSTGPTDPQPGKRYKGGGGSDTSGSQGGKDVGRVYRGSPQQEQEDGVALRGLVRGNCVSDINPKTPVDDIPPTLEIGSRGSRSSRDSAANSGGAT